MNNKLHILLLAVFAAGLCLCAHLDAFAAPSPKAKPAKKTAAKDAPAEKALTNITVYYFHGNARCSSCRKLEQYTKAAVELNFSTGPFAGRAHFAPVNIDKPENRHFIADYKLVSKAVVLQPEKGGKCTNLDQIWLMLEDKDAFLAYIRDGIIKALEAK